MSDDDARRLDAENALYVKAQLREHSVLEVIRQRDEARELLAEHLELAPVYLTRVWAEVARQDGVSTYGTDRDGVRLALACLQDELDETLEAFQAEKRPIEGRTWPRVQDELVQVLAIGLRLLRDLDEAA